jgi:tetratricopeptide (TPR) repeat protein
MRHRTRYRRGVGLGMTLLTLGTTAGAAQEHGEHPLGSVSFPISCSRAAQREFNRAVALLHHMTYPQARAAFTRVARLDRSCAMAEWGIAMTLFQPLWPTRPSPAELQRGWKAVETARARKPRTERERQLIDAAAAFFQDPGSTDYWARIRRWEQAMGRAHRAFPDDPEVTAFYALAHLAAAPSDTTARSHWERAADLLLEVYQKNPDHPGAMHYLVHANDAPEREGQSLEVTRKYQAVAPRNPHALHMPTHIYVRLGDWNAVIKGNLLAAEAALEHPAGENGQFVWDEFPHAIEYLVYAYLQKGQDEDAMAQVNRLRETARLQPTFKTAFHLASTRARYALERQDWEEAAALPPRDPPSLEWDRFTWPEAVSWFARGLGAARTGHMEEAGEAARRLLVLQSAAANTGEMLFARNVQVLALELNGWLAQARRDRDSAIALLRQAAELEESTPKHAVTPAPTLPGYELLGDLLLEQEKPAEALVAYRRALEHHPGRFNSLLGAARAARGSGANADARKLYQQLLDVAGEGTRIGALDEARAFISPGK